MHRPLSLVARLPVLTLLLAFPLVVRAQTRPAAPSAPARQQELVCPHCQHVNRPDAKFCAECGTVLRKGGCPRCGAPIVAGEKFCTQCGLPVPATSGEQPAAPQNPVPGSPAGPTQQTPGPPPVEPHVAPEPPPGGEVTYPAFKIGGFHDIVYASDSHNSPHGFSLGQFVLHMNSLLAPNMQFFAELSFTPRSDAGLGSPAAPGYSADVERAIFRFDQSDLLRFSAGRYHTPINWWNTAYHHGLWLQTTIFRPEMARFGGQFIPVHFVGGLVEGTTPAHGANLNYKIGLGNGRGPVASRAGDFGDSNSALAWLVNLYVRPERLYGWQFGGALYRDKISLTGGPQVDEQITSAHLVLETETPEIIAEYAHVDHRPAGGPTLHSDAYYAQVAYRLPDPARRWKPYVRYERIWVPAGDPVYTSTPSLHGILGGVRWDFTDFAALKFEWRDFRRSTLPYSTGFFSQLSYTF